MSGAAPGDVPEQPADEILPAEESFVVVWLERLHPRIGTRGVVQRLG